LLVLSIPGIFLLIPGIFFDVSERKSSANPAVGFGSTKEFSWIALYLNKNIEIRGYLNVLSYERGCPSFGTASSFG
jgi:hypothetical protein